ncbi:hypothetical protein STRDD10_00429 [Streptococcus sp. DD10]|uniref:hypothetical protein n=1 Tax=Streptococcus sp. DD10 TaxID=1777878 RepID=UPI0007921971|nr:hypothetical protein [Streptococcus sp. DD10]KXT75155.1 hypothetical protein STRDD10_00429 [Streptococcus sp. DD10]
MNEVVINIDALTVEEYLIQNEAEDITEVADKLENSKIGSMTSIDKILWTVKEKGIKHTLLPKNLVGTYPYRIEGKGRWGPWGRIYQLTYDEAMWKTMEFAPEFLDCI